MSDIIYTCIASTYHPSHRVHSFIHSLYSFILSLPTAEDELDNDDDDDDITVSDSESLVSVEERSHTSERSVHAKMIKLTQDLIPASMRSQQYTTDYSGDGHGGDGRVLIPPLDTSYHPPPLDDSPKSSSSSNKKVSEPSSSSEHHHNHHHHHQHRQQHQYHQQMESNIVVVDPRDGLEQLPVYLKGGVDTVGFGELLGNALALLYVARQGNRAMIYV